MNHPAFAQLQRDVDRQTWTHLERILDTWGVARGAEILNARFGTSFTPLSVQAIAQRYQTLRAVQ